VIARVAEIEHESWDFWFIFWVYFCVGYSVIHLNLVNQSAHKLPRRFVEDFVRRIEKHLLLRKIKIPKDQELVIAFVESPVMKKLNKTWRGKNSVTDILSFDNGVGWGELVISPEVIRLQAKEQRLSFHLELGYMILHGCLHLLGYEHEKSKKQALAMFALQDAIFSDIRSELKR
jgi:probable rRNA maturation factor